MEGIKSVQMDNDAEHSVVKPESDANNIFTNATEMNEKNVESVFFLESDISEATSLVPVSVSIEEGDVDENSNDEKLNLEDIIDGIYYVKCPVCFLKYVVSKIVAHFQEHFNNIERWHAEREKKLKEIEAYFTTSINHLCLICGILLDNAEKLSNHLDVNRSTHCVECIECNIQFRNFYLMWRHDKLIHKSKPFESNVMNKLRNIFSREFSSTKKISTKKLDFVMWHFCSKCFFHTRYNNILYMHHLEKHSEEDNTTNFSENKGNQSIVKKTVNQVKMSSEVTYKCAYCSIENNQKDIIKNHVLTKHSDQPLCMIIVPVNSNQTDMRNKCEQVLNCKFCNKKLLLDELNVHLEKVHNVKNVYASDNRTLPSIKENQVNQHMFISYENNTSIINSSQKRTGIMTPTKIQDRNLSNESIVPRLIPLSDLRQKIQKENMANNGASNTLPCLICLKKIHRDFLKGHIKVHFELYKYACAYCDFTSYNIGIVRCHISANHANATIRYVLIPDHSLRNKFNQMKNDINAYLTENGVTPFPHDIPTETIAGGESTSTPQNVSSLNYFRCTACQFQTISFVNFHRHKSKHVMIEKIFKCNTCPYTSGAQYPTFMHVLRKHKNIKDAIFKKMHRIHYMVLDVYGRCLPQYVDTSFLKDKVNINPVVKCEKLKLNRRYKLSFKNSSK